MSYTFLAAAGFGNHRRLLEAVLGNSEMTTGPDEFLASCLARKLPTNKKIKGVFEK